MGKFKTNIGTEGGLGRILKVKLCCYLQGYKNVLRCKGDILALVCSILLP